MHFVAYTMPSPTPYPPTPSSIQYILSLYILHYSMRIFPGLFDIVFLAEGCNHHHRFPMFNMDLQKSQEETLREAACIGDFEGIQELLTKGVNPNSQNAMNGW